MIPKIIWQTHESLYEDLFPFQKNVINTWKNINPGWQHIYVGSNERHKLIKEYDDFLYDCYIVSNGVNQADIWRLVTLYKNGGFYADMDSVCTQSIDNILKNEYKGQEMVCGTKNIKDSFINNSNFGSIKNSNIVKEILDNIILKYKIILNDKKNNIKNLPPGIPCLGIFSEITIKNQKNIFFNNKYFSHSKDYKAYFNPQYYVLYNEKSIDYLKLCNLNNWHIY